MCRTVCSLVLEFRVYCLPSYYNTQCSKTCFAQDGPTEHYTCDPATGDKVCRAGKSRFTYLQGNYITHGNKVAVCISRFELSFEISKWSNKPQFNFEFACQAGKATTATLLRTIASTIDAPMVPPVGTDIVNTRASVSLDSQVPERVDDVIMKTSPLVRIANRCRVA